MSLGTHISRLRAENHLSQGDLAEALDVSRQSVSKWETDASVPDLDKLVKLAQLFGVTLDQLVNGDPPETPAAEPPAPPHGDIPQSFEHPAVPHRLAGIILLCMAFLVVLVLTMLGGLLEGLVLAAPFILCGVICLTTHRRTGLWCAWAIYLSVELYLRWATGLTWSLTLRTLVFTPEENYTRLAIAWGQLLVMLLMLFLTVRSFRKVRLDLHKRKHLILTVGGWIVLAVLYTLKNMGYALLYQSGLLNFGLGVRLLLRGVDILFLPLFAAVLTATFCLLRSRKTAPET